MDKIGNFIAVYCDYKYLQLHPPKIHPRTSTTYIHQTETDGLQYASVKFTGKLCIKLYCISLCLNEEFDLWPYCRLYMYIYIFIYIYMIQTSTANHK